MSHSKLDTVRRKLLGRALAAEHTAIEERLAALREQAKRGDWHDVDAHWDDFAKRLNEHLSFEEQTLLPRFSASGSRQKAEARALVEEHRKLRATLENVGVEIQMEHTAALADVVAFLSALRAHAAREDRMFYPWLDANDEEPEDEARV